MIILYMIFLIPLTIGQVPSCPKQKTVGDICYERDENDVDTSTYGCTANCTYKKKEYSDDDERFCFKPGDLPVVDDCIYHSPEVGDTIDTDGDKCKTIATRVNARSLAPSTIRDYDILLAVIKPGSEIPVKNNSLLFESIGSYHGLPHMCNFNKTASGTDQYCCIPHTAPGSPPIIPDQTVLFTSWHRLLVFQMEESLRLAAQQLFYPVFAMPYWDWTTPPSAGESTIPYLANKFEGEWTIGPIPPGSGTSRTVTRRDLQPLVYTELITQVKQAYTAKTFPEFNQQIIGPHNYIHRHVGGDMRTIEWAAYDPVFYLHHSYVDYQYAYFQELQKLRNRPISFGGYETFKMQPFDRQSNPIPVSRTHSEGPQGLDYKATFCYRYDELLFQGLTPEQFIENEKEESKLPHLYAGLFLKQTGITSRVSFALLHNDTKTYAGSLSTFGSTNQNANFSASAPKYIILYDVTELVKNISLNIQDNDLKFTVSNYTDGLGNSLPITETYQPIVIYQEPNSESYTFRLHVEQVHEYAPVMYGRIGHQVEFLKNGKVVSGDDDVKTWVGGTDDDTEAGKPVEGRVAIEYQEHRFIIHNQHGQTNITIGYDLDSFECDKENFPVSVDPYTKILPWNLEWLKENPVVDITNCPGTNTIIASCDRTLSTVKKVDENDYDDCTNLWTRGTAGIYGLLVDTSNPGTYYFADGKKAGNQNYCNLGWKIAINVVDCEQH